MRWRLEAFATRLGAAGVIGLGVFLACIGFYVSALAPAQKDLAAQRLALERLRSRTPHQPVAAAGRADDLRRFYALFPASTDVGSELQRVHRLARRAGLELAQGEYRLERRPIGLWAYRITLPVRGTYPQLRDLLGALLKEMPIASLEALRFERKKTEEAQLEAQLRITVHVRSPGESP